MHETTASLFRDARGWWGEVTYVDGEASFSLSRGYFETLDELDKVMRDELRNRTAEARDKWFEVVARQRADA